MFNFTINLVESRHLYLTLSSSSVAHLALSLPTPTLSITVHERAHWLLSGGSVFVSVTHYCCFFLFHGAASPCVKFLSGHIRSALPAQTFHNPPTPVPVLCHRVVGNHSHFFSQSKPLCSVAVLYYPPRPLLTSAPSPSPPHLFPTLFPNSWSQREGVLVAQLSIKDNVLSYYLPFPQLGGGMVIEDLSLFLNPSFPTLCGRNHINLSRSETAHPPQACL